MTGLEIQKDSGYQRNPTEIQEKQEYLYGLFKQRNYSASIEAGNIPDTKANPTFSERFMDGMKHFEEQAQNAFKALGKKIGELPMTEKIMYTGAALFIGGAVVLIAFPLLPALAAGAIAWVAGGGCVTGLVASAFDVLIHQ